MTDYKPGRGQRIERLYAWVGKEPDGGEGLLAAQTTDGVYMPLIGADRERIESLRAVARAIERLRGQPVWLVCYGSKEVLEGPVEQ